MTNVTGLQMRAAIRASKHPPVPERGLLRYMRRHVHEAGIVERMARFQTFCAETQPLAWTWGATDCSMLVASWVQMNGHPDPAPHLRGAYDSEDGYRAIVKAAGGLLAVVDDCASRAGLSRIKEPRFGAVAVIGARTDSMRQWSAIWNGGAWLVRWRRDEYVSWVPFRARPLAIWRV